MGNKNSLGFVKLATAFVLILLMAPSPAVAESDYLYQFNPDKYLHLGYNMNELRAQSEGESLAGSETDSAQPASDDAGQVSAKELSQQSANPVGKLAFIFTQFAATFNDGDLNTGNSHLAGNITFQPIIPIPLYGSGEDEWRIVTRPTINLSIAQPVPDGEVNDFDRETELGDLLVPLPLAFPERITGKWLLALGPSFSFPTATDDDFGKEQWTAGGSGVFGYIAENWMAGIYPQTYFRIADAKGRDDDTRAAQFGNMFYWFWYNITDDWQIGTNPTIQWDHKAGSGNKWNIPVGFSAAKMTKFGNLPVRIEFGAEYSVVNQDDYGEVARFKINIIPLVSRPIKKSIFGE
jgi:hypothetical protein